MKAFIRVTAFALFLLPVITFAQEPQAHPLAGIWSGPMVEGQNDTQVILDLRIQGDVVTGPIAWEQAGDLYIRDGKATANSIEFTSPALNPADGNVALIWRGELTGNGQIAFSITREDQQGESRAITVTRQNP